MLSANPSNFKLPLVVNYILFKISPYDDVGGLFLHIDCWRIVFLSCDHEVMGTIAFLKYKTLYFLTFDIIVDNRIILCVEKNIYELHH